jgi:hypothetical protein
MSEMSSEEPLGFASDVRPLFSESDRDSMLWAFDLWSCDDVVAHGEEISARLEDGTMPCDDPWPDEQVRLFKRWLEQGRRE